ncbi:hypothetical protein GF360_03010 [candidate division WWE3 bacterium]|nr:hypothetical protein [candidate division WWE3 bacterium]
MLDKKLRKKLSIVYVVLLAATGIFISLALKREPLKVREKESAKTEIEVKPVKVQLEIEGGPTYAPSREEIETENVATVADFLNKLRNDTNFSFEKTAYTYGTEIDHINGRYPQENKRWAIFLGEKDITYEIGKINLKDDQVYTAKIIRTSKPQ